MINTDSELDQDNVEKLCGVGGFRSAVLNPRSADCLGFGKGFTALGFGEGGLPGKSGFTGFTKQKSVCFCSASTDPDEINYMRRELKPLLKAPVEF